MAELTPGCPQDTFDGPEDAPKRVELFPNDLYEPVPAFLSVRGWSEFFLRDCRGYFSFLNSLWKIELVKSEIRDLFRESFILGLICLFGDKWDFLTLFVLKED